MQLLDKNNYLPNIINIILAFAENIHDDLNLSQSTECKEILNRLGNNLPKKERIILSENIIKINKRGKSQNRIIVITDKSLYNFKTKCIQRNPKRINLQKIVSITVSPISNEFVLHIPGQCDLRYKSDHKDLIISIISEKYKYRTKEELVIDINSINTSKTIESINRKTILPSRLTRFNRHQELIAKQKFDDEIEYAKQARMTGYLFESDQKVNFTDFEFLKLIQRGRYTGKVLEVRKTDNNKIYALEILKKKALIAKHEVQHTSAERRLLPTQQHPFLFPLRYGFQTEDKLYFVKQYPRCENLFVCLQREGKFSEQEARFIVAEVVLLFEYLHGMNVIYKDLTPENMFIENTGHIYLWDCYVTSGVDATYDLFGTPEYVAPELIAKVDYDKTVDWWCIGVLLYELIFGMTPFEGESIDEVYQKIKGSEEIIFHTNISDECRDIIIRLLERNPSKRLGAGWNDANYIKKHEFFKDVDWNMLYQKKLNPPYKPDVNVM